jgi:hypothetical protein
VGELADQINSEESDNELRKTAQRLSRQLATAKHRSAELVEAVYQAARDAAVVVGKPDPIPPPGKDARKKKPEVVIVHASDWQIGKKTISFDSDIAAQRIEMLAQKVIQLTEIQRADHPVRECHLFLGGDMVEGVTVFPAQAWEVDSTLFTQIFHTVDLCERLVRHLLGNFDIVHIDCEPGNHGRLGRKGDFPAVDNADSIVYRILSDRISSDKRVDFTLPQSWYQLPVVGNYKPLLVHGDEIKSFGGNTPAFGILRKCNAWASGVIPPFKDVYMGHFHSPNTFVMANGNSVRMNGTLESDSDYAREFVAATGRPCQRLVFVEPERGRVTSDHVVWLDG